MPHPAAAPQASKLFKLLLHVALLTKIRWQDGFLAVTDTDIPSLAGLTEGYLGYPWELLSEICCLELFLVNLPVTAQEAGGKSLFLAVHSHLVRGKSHLLEQ